MPDGCTLQPCGQLASERALYAANVVQFWPLELLLWLTSQAHQNSANM